MLGSTTAPVNIYSEFQPLEEMIVGRPYSPRAFDHLEDKDLRALLQRVMEETEEDCDKLSALLESLGVKVQRPKVILNLMDENGKFDKVNLQKFSYTYPNPPLWPRDMFLTYGNQILNLYTRSNSRWLESWSFYQIFHDYFAQGANWLSLPPPIIDFDKKSYAAYEKEVLLFHAACFVRCGKDIFHTLPGIQIENGRGTELGLEWIRRQLGEGVRLNPVQQQGHLDGKIAFIRPGLMVGWISKEQLPEKLQSWDLIRLKSKGELPTEFLEMKNRRYYKGFVEKWMSEWIGSVEETYFDVNIISVNEKLVITNGASEYLTGELNKRGVETIPFNFRHRYFWDGGLHCITLDVRRRGGCEDYFS